MMDVKEAVATAKQKIIELFADEKLKNVGLEEVKFDVQAYQWVVTIGFSRPWDEPRNPLSAIGGGALPRRDYKIICISNTSGEVVAIKNYELKN